MQMSHRKDPSSVRIREVLLEMRRYRMGLIQTADQLRFSYLAVIEGAKYIGRDGDLSLQASLTSLLWNNTFHSVYCLFRFRYKSHSIKTTHLFLFSLEYFCTQSGFISPLKDSWKELSNEEDDVPEFTPPPPLPPPREPHNGKLEPAFFPENNEIIQHVEFRSLG